MAVTDVDNTEESRLADLYDHHILDTPPTAAFDELIELASLVCDAPIAAVSLIDRNRQWFKAIKGLAVIETPRSHSICSHTIQQKDLLVIPDTRLDPRLQACSHVLEQFAIRFYAGVPLITEDGNAIGSLCVIDNHTRSLSETQQSALRALGRQAEKHLANLKSADQLKRLVLKQNATSEALHESEQRLQRLSDSAYEGIAISQNGVIIDANAAFVAQLGYSVPSEVIGLSAVELAVQSYRETVQKKIDMCDEEPYEALLYRRDGSTFPAELRGRLTSYNGKPARVTAVRDLTEVQTLERHVRERDARFRVLFEVSSHAHLIFDETDGIIDCNSAALRMMHCTDRSAVLGRHPAMLSPLIQPDGRRSDEKGAEMCRLARQNGSHVFEWQRQTLDGYTYPVETTLTSIVVDGKCLFLSVWQDLTERKRHEEEMRVHTILLEIQKEELVNLNSALQMLATTDGLTNLNNRRTFQKRLEEEIERSTRYSAPLCLIMLDVDHFKAYNDCHGHLAGDELLIRIAKTIQTVVRITDFVARFGGEEFAIILPDTYIASAIMVAERIRNAIQTNSNENGDVTASLGVAYFSSVTDDASEIIMKADAALYRAKSDGRNRVHSAVLCHTKD